jgi:hypothetical protein
LFNSKIDNSLKYMVSPEKRRENESSIISATTNVVARENLIPPRANVKRV